MFSNILVAFILLGVAAANYGGNSYRPRYGRDDSSSSSTESYKKWKCPRVKTFRLKAPDMKQYFSEPQIGYFTEGEKEKAVVVCKGPTLELLISKSEDANPELPQDFKNIKLSSFSTNAGVVLSCKENGEKYEAYNYLNHEIEAITSVACVADSEEARIRFQGFFNTFRSEPY